MGDWQQLWPFQTVVHETKAHHAIVADANVGDALLGRYAVPGQGVGSRIVGEHVIGGSREQVSGKILSLSSVGLHQVVARIDAAIDGVHVPSRLVVVDVNNHESATGKITVPPYLLTVLQRKILVGIAGCHYSVGRIVLCQLQQFHRVGRGVDIDEVEPS